MQGRVWQCSTLRKSWTMKKSICLALLITMFIVCNQQGWLPGPSGPWKKPLADTFSDFHSILGIVNLNKSLGSPLWGTLRPLSDLSLQPADGVVGEAAGAVQVATVGVTGVGDSLSTSKSLQKKLGVGGPYRYILNEPFKCRDRTPVLVLLITVEPGNVMARNAIRQTWANEAIGAGPAFVRLFFLGTRQNINADVQSKIKEESNVYHDIIQQDYQDTYKNLTIKVLMGMYWVNTYCPNASYVMKTDSDMFVNTEYLIKKLLQPELPPKKKYFTGVLMGGGPIRDKNSKWYMSPELYPSNRYPPFCSGTGYVFSEDLSKLIYQSSLSITMLHLEDVYVGLCLEKLQIGLTAPPNNAFQNWYVSYSHCRYRNLATSHGISPNDIIKFWNDMESNKNKTC